MLDLIVPGTYQQWLECFEKLSEKPVADSYICSLKEGTCPGIERVMVPFLERAQDTVNRMLNRSARCCTRLVNEALEDGDFSNMETVLYRNYKEMMRCRFYLNIGFLPQKLLHELDQNTVSEIDRYWEGLKKNFEDLADETGDSNIYDILYYINRLISTGR